MNDVKSGSNRFELRLPLELQMLLHEDMAKNKQYIGTAVLRALAEYYKDRLTPQEYEALMKKYSMTAKEQRLKNQKKRLEREANRKKRIKQRDLALELKKREIALKEAKAQEKTLETNKPRIGELKREKATLEQELRREESALQQNRERLKNKRFDKITTEDRTKKNIKTFSKRIKDLKANIEAINVELKALGVN